MARSQGPGLLLVLSDPGEVPEAEFHAWYDEEHIPARTALPQLRHATRWRAVDEESPGWLATYDVSDLLLLGEPSYTRLRERRSPREQRVLASLGALDRRVYAQVADAPGPGWSESAPGRLLLMVSLDVPAEHERELAQWYNEVHVPLLHRVDGWLRTRRYRLVEGSAPQWLAVHDLTGTHVFDSPAYAAATSPGQRDQVMSRVTRRERRLFEVHRRSTAASTRSGHPTLEPADE